MRRVFASTSVANFVEVEEAPALEASEKSCLRSLLDNFGVGQGCIFDPKPSKLAKNDCSMVFERFPSLAKSRF
jgi:hypothetical protein